MATLLIVCLAYSVIGIISGMLAGLLGIGGGVVTVPCLYVVFHVLGYPEARTMHMAIGTSLAAMVFSTFFLHLGASQKAIGAMGLDSENGSWLNCRLYFRGLGR